MLYTRKGDTGESGLFGTKERFAKDSSIYEALGTLDELNSLCGLCRAKFEALPHDSIHIANLLHAVQGHLFIVQAEFAGADKAIAQKHIDWLEQTIDVIEKTAGNPRAFVIPGANEMSALLDLARAVSRRAERTLVHARATREVSTPTYAYMNRLSSLLYALARYAAYSEEISEDHPTYA
jgi:cob(I)alamin adenosyltransferase